MFFPFVIEFVRIALEQDFGESQYPVQRSAQIMGHGIAEGFQVLVRRRELLCPALNFSMCCLKLIHGPYALEDFP